eukprot:370445-Prymnesium_polylepis.1
MFKPELAAATPTRPGAAPPGGSTVGRRFLQDLGSLLQELQGAQPYFIRCIKPNMKQVRRDFDCRLVLEQLRNSGLIGAVALMQQVRR